MVSKLSPQQLTQVFLVWGVGLAPGVGGDGMPQPADGQCSEFQVRRKPTRSIRIEPIAVLIVARKVIRKELIEAPLGGAFTTRLEVVIAGYA
jgi:hypothetical protein